ncbi:MAG: TldD/PmbA family protein [Candidatus Jordarchaeum sp.]|uniref:TldD/PmbA family protein n=1 Tax=Candidatus Jordarchaeum sp. TaxID=2823881 RepID=UPI0040493127
MSEILGSVEGLIPLAERMGADEVEVYVASGKSFEIEVRLGQITSSHSIFDSGIGVRAVINKAVGFGFCNSLEKKKLEEITEKAIQIARSGKPDSNWSELPYPSSFPVVRGIYDKRIIELSVEDMVEITGRMLQAASEYDRRVMPFWGGVGSGYAVRGIINNHGVEVSEKGTMIGCVMGTIAREGYQVTPECSESDYKRSLNINPENVGREAARQAIDSLRPKKVETGVYPVILAQDALTSLLTYTLVPTISGDNIIRDKSAYKDKIGTLVASEILTIEDDGVMERGLSTCAFDGEGTSSQKTIIIQNGILKSFIFDNYFGRRAGAKSTGNAKRGGYAATPSISPTNLYVKEGDKNPDKMVSEIDDGFFIRDLQGAHSSNSESGEVSVVATPCWKIEKGEIKNPIKGAMLAGNIYNMLKDIKCIGNNIRQLAYLVAPWISFEKVRIVGET